MSSASSLASQEHKQFAPQAANNPVPITTEPESPTMDAPRRSSGQESSSTDYSDNHSGYHRDTNECTEFCFDLFQCFGACEACCPLSGEGCLSSTAAFFGNICVTCWKC